MGTTNLKNPLLAVFVFSALAASGCGGDGGKPAPAPPPAPAESLFVQANAWGESMPAEADAVSNDEFRRRISSGEATLAKPQMPEAERLARRKLFDDSRAYLMSLTDRSEQLDALLAEAAVAARDEGDREAILPGGQHVMSMDITTRLAQAAESQRHARDPQYARESYARLYALLSAAERTGLPAPESLSSATRAEVAQADADVDARLAARADLDGTRIEADATPNGSQGTAARMKALAAGPGNGVDNAGGCSPRYLFKRYWFPLKNFISPVKDQGRRAVCWAFTVVGAIESRERVQNATTPDLSEQFFVNKVKHEWLPSDYVDGGWPREALNAAADRNQQFAFESSWTYNGGPDRTDTSQDPGVVGTRKSYVGVCSRYSGWCSLSSHQSEGTCTDSNGAIYCAYQKMVYDFAGVAPSRERQVWASGQAFNLNELRALLAAGYSLVAAFDVYEGFLVPDSQGEVTDYARQMRNKAGTLVDGSYGGHIAQIVGFISNEDMSFAGVQANVGGGGYFILRNSWGCSGDGGFWYVPADYVSSRFTALDVLEFSADRSPKWVSDQVAPGSAEPLTIDPKGAGAVDLRVPANLAGMFEVKHAVANYVRLRVVSDIDGVLYDGQWMVNAPPQGGLFVNSLPVTFKMPGTRTLSLTATYGSSQVSVTKLLYVVNSPPTVVLTYSGLPQQGEPFVVTAQVIDINEPDVAGMCNNMQWSVEAPDALIGGNGCMRTVRFGAQGSRTVRASTHDTEGVDASALLELDVAPPPVNPYPRVTDAAVFARDTQTVSGQPVACVNARVANGATIDLRDLGCNGVLIPGPEIPRYFGHLTIENPGAESLSYDWAYRVYTAQGSQIAAQRLVRTQTPEIDLGALVFGFAGESYNCDLWVQVNAPEATRSKTLAVWSGRCFNVPAGPN